MKQKLTLLSIALLTLFSINANAQDDERDKEYVKSYIGIFGGLSHPLGNFASTNYYNNSAGFAKQGATTGIDAAYYFHKNWAISATLSFQDQGELNQNDVNNLSNNYNTDFVKAATNVTSINRYQNLMFIVGPQRSFVYKVFTFDVGASLGFIKNTSSPSLSIVFDNTTNASLILHQLSSTSTAFAYGGHANVRYNFGGNWFLVLRGNYVNSPGITIENTNHTDNYGRLVTKQPISVFQTSLGMSLHF